MWSPTAGPATSIATARASSTAATQAGSPVVCVGASVVVTASFSCGVSVRSAIKCVTRAATSRSRRPTPGTRLALELGRDGAHDRGDPLARVAVGVLPASQSGLHLRLEQLDHVLDHALQLVRR